MFKALKSVLFSLAKICFGRLNVGVLALNSAFVMLADVDIAIF